MNFTAGGRCFWVTKNSLFKRVGENGQRWQWCRFLIHLEEPAHKSRFAKFRAVFDHKKNRLTGVVRSGIELHWLRCRWMFRCEMFCNGVAASLNNAGQRNLTESFGSCIFKTNSLLQEQAIGSQQQSSLLTRFLLHHVVGYMSQGSPVLFLIRCTKLAPNIWIRHKYSLFGANE